MRRMKRIGRRNSARIIGAKTRIKSPEQMAITGVVEEPCLLYVFFFEPFALEARDNGEVLGIASRAPRAAM